MTKTPIPLLIAASGTGGHLFPALAVAEKLTDYQIEWLGVPDRLETRLVPESYPLHTIAVEGFQERFGLNTLRIFQRLAGSIRQVRRLLKERQIELVFTTGGYIASPTILAARSLGLPVILHESNALPGKVTRWFAPFCTSVALGFSEAAQYLPRSRTVWVGTPVRSIFLTPQQLDLPIPESAFLIVVVGGSQGAVAVNQMVRECAPAWFAAGAYLIHLTGDRDPDVHLLEHPQYLSLPFYENMAALLQRANLAISRAGAGTLTELAVSKTPAILIPYPYAAEDHQAYNAAVFQSAGAALVYPQAQLTPEILKTQVLELIANPAQLAQMAQQATDLAVTDSSDRLAKLLRLTLSVQVVKK
ncbi:undecaprenyldiphospho-muramoylpentapeptide beta-N-acetylglucosaminyltransferase [Oscillatoria salina]|uniref:undecaprenyldiphospho-muramoylpentapeptide beta-N-acetylglucosaminyltransferase n=1 Tax=Oscillatoria salina TaxID=331517 RepID=UPI0013B72C58|nr:undecaprenyldiphospho-muramoylpentapeptide beta-N-acetylglucosaminyltransferase [Oscillatoria salina]MBZ8180579.1 undecaprenyldiphospho-muramoylpentapeptide beta-N-acetylglucosaminyltransferase [Oscillatoria salina IIICB1]NET90316.1 undecaprenyldiphospho-muramoylpentapeptide beta-N-acetylglucosaminyltransferase [Kamptonema sp. SIO1D9]